MASLSFGVSRLHGGAQLEAAARSFCEVIAAQMELAPHVVIVAGYTDLLQAILDGQTQLAWLPPLPLARALQGGAILACLSQRRGRLTYRSALVVRNRSLYTSTLALADSRAAWTTPTSASGYLMPRAYLLEHGIAPDRQLASETFFGSTLLACKAVADGNADFATCYVSDSTSRSDATAEMMQTLGPELGEKLRVLEVTDSIPPDGIVLSSLVEATSRARLRAALLELHAHEAGQRAIASLMQAERLASPTYDAMRLLTRLSARA